MDQEQKLDNPSSVAPDANLPSESAAPRAICRTVTLTDEPEETDAFSGPHQRIADAVAQLIQPEDAKGISIGIEGSWGSGKSTVARLLIRKLEADKNIAVVSFDAWAHEGDPLRRTFLETIIRNLKNRGWVKQATWDERIEELANRREVVTTKDKLTITRSGRLIAFILLLIPIGSAFITAALRENITLFTWTPHWRFLILFSIGLALTFIPLIVLFRRIKSEPDIVAFLFNKGPTEKTTETSKTANPTSIEFEDSFKKLFEEALEADKEKRNDQTNQEKQHRRVVLILDNLDRVESKDALTIWSTLQTFLQHKGTARPNWHERLWLVVLYDINGLSQLWANTNENEAAISFIDKSFQIRFEVPALVLSDWREFLMTQLGKAFPDHDESDFHEVYRILAIWLAKRIATEEKKHFTIRELKLFVNQIGSVHRQWAGADPAADSFPLSLVSYYALLRRANASIVTSLFDPEFPAKEYHELLGSSARESLAALAFNVEVDVAQQLLFGDKIKNALTLAEKDELARVASLLRKGFWEVFEDVAREWASTESVKIADAALAIEESGILNGAFGPSVRSVTRFFCDRATSVPTWSPLDARRAHGIAILLRWKKGLNDPEQHNEQFVDVLSKAFSLGLTAVDSKLTTNEWLDYLSVTLKELEPTKQQRSLTTIVDAFANRFQLMEPLAPFQVEFILEVLCELHERTDLAPAIELRLATLVDTGKIAAQLRRDTPLSDASVTWITYVLIRYSSTSIDLHFEKQGQEKALAFVSTEQMVPSFVSILERYKDTALLFHLWKTAPDLQPLIVASLKVIIEKVSAKALFVTDDVLDRLEIVCSHLGHNDEEEALLVKLISEIAQRTNLAKEITSRAFDMAHANLYLLCLKAGGRDQKQLVSWCLNGLRSLNSEDWNYGFRLQHRVLALAFYLEETGANLNLGEPYFQALSSYLDFPQWGVISNPLENPASLIGPLGSTHRNAFQDNLEKRIKSEVELPGRFFEVFGLELKAQLLDSSRGGKVIALLPHIVKSKHVGGLIWLTATLKEVGPRLNSQYSNEENWKEFKYSIKRALVTQPFGKKKPHQIKIIANVLSISAPKNGLVAFTTPEQDKICTLDPNNLKTEVLIEGALPNYGRVSHPSWSPDGKKLAYVDATEPSGQSEIFILDYSSGNKTKATDTSISSHHPSLSPDGKMLAFVRGKGPYSDIFTLNLETSEQRRLTGADAINEHPRWSPDGTSLVFRRLINNESQIFVMAADGSNRKMITSGPSDFDPCWSPDEQNITFARLHESAEKSGIYSTSLEGTAMQLVQESNAHAPVWSPDGRKLLFQVGRGAEARIYQVDANGQNKKELTRGGSPTWQPVFDDDSDGTTESSAAPVATTN